MGLIVDSPVWDGGKVKPGATLTHAFEMTNTSAQTIVIEGIQKSCGCTSVKPSTRSIPPGEHLTVDCVVDTSGRRSSITTSFLVLYKNRGSTESRAGTRCTISAAIENLVIIFPSHLTFDSHKGGDVGVDVVCPKGDRITAVTSDDVSVSAHLESSGRISVKFMPEKWSPGHQGHLQVVIHTTCPTEPQIPVTVDVN